MTNDMLERESFYKVCYVIIFHVKGKKVTLHLKSLKLKMHLKIARIFFLMYLINKNSITFVKLQKIECHLNLA